MSLKTLFSLPSEDSVVVVDCLLKSTQTMAGISWGPVENCQQSRSFLKKQVYKTIHCQTCIWLSNKMVIYSSPYSSHGREASVRQPSEPLRLTFGS